MSEKEGRERECVRVLNGVGRIYREGVVAHALVIFLIFPSLEHRKRHYGLFSPWRLLLPRKPPVLPGSGSGPTTRVISGHIQSSL